MLSRAFRKREVGRMVKNKKARAEGFARGLKGKRDAAGVLQGWTDDKASGVARTEGWVSGKRKRSQLEAEVEAQKKAKAKK
jgi:hypothetical protein